MGSLLDNRAVSPCQKFLKWDSTEACFTSYDKETKETIKYPDLEFVCLKDLVTIKGWDDNAKTGIWSNEIDDLKGQKLNVKCKTNGVVSTIASGLYSEVKDAVKARGGKYTISQYIGVMVDGEMQIWNLNLAGSARGAWFDFTNLVRSVYGGKVIKFAGFDVVKKNKVLSYNVPKFEITGISEELESAKVLASELLDYLTVYLRETQGESLTAQPSETSSYLDLADENDEEKVPANGQADDLPF